MVMLDVCKAELERMDIAVIVAVYIRARPAVWDCKKNDLHPEENHLCAPLACKMLLESG